MDTRATKSVGAIPLGIGFYSSADASRLLKVPARSINRWMKGYSYRQDDRRHDIPPLWIPQLPLLDDQLELGFRDLIELRFVKAFVDAGLGLRTIRYCLDYARSLTNEDRPFSTRRFRTDGKTMFLESARLVEAAELLDLKTRQYVLPQIIDRTFRDLDIDDDIVARWRPLDGKQSIVLDPTRAFGQPIAAAFGVPTATLRDAVEAEGSAEAAARLFELPVSVVRDAVLFENRLEAA